MRNLPLGLSCLSGGGLGVSGSQGPDTYCQRDPRRKKDRLKCPPKPQHLYHLRRLFRDLPGRDRSCGPVEKLGDL